MVIENISLVNNYRAQLSRVLARSSYAELLEIMKQKKLSAPRKDCYGDRCEPCSGGA